MTLNLNSTLISEALEFATKAHAGQVRKYTGEPYINHVVSVATAVQNLMDSTELDVIIALLHDVVEDTAFNFTAIEKKFGTAAAQGVWWLTDTETKLGNRNTRKMLDRMRLALAPRNVANIKLCDLLDNAGTIMDHDPDFAQRYMGEKYQLLAVLRGDNLLTIEAKTLVMRQPFFDDPEWRARYGAA